MAVVSAIATVVGIGLQAQAAKKQRKFQQRQAAEASASRAREEALQKKRADIEASRQRRRAAAEARRFRSQALNLAANRGAGGAIGAQGSTVPGVTGNIQSQLNFNNAFINRVTTLNNQIRGEQSNLANVLGQVGPGPGFGAFLTAFGKLGFTAAKSGLFSSSPGGGNSFAPNQAGSSSQVFS